MERFLASPYCKIIVLCFVLLLVLGFGYHVAHNLRLARQHSPAPPPHSDSANAPPLSR
jgi:energy-converting hydrogenase Eha subunit F